MRGPNPRFLDTAQQRSRTSSLRSRSRILSRGLTAAEAALFCRDPSGDVDGDGIVDGCDPVNDLPTPTPTPDPEPTPTPVPTAAAEVPSSSVPGLGLLALVLLAAGVVLMRRR